MTSVTTQPAARTFRRVGGDATPPWVRRLAALTLAVGLVVAACAKKAEEAARSAWDAAVRGPGAGDGDGESNGPGGGDDPQRDAEEWTAVTAVVDDIGEAFAPGVATVDLEALAERLCGRPPDRREEGGEMVFTCEPDPRLLVMNESLEYEISTSGVVGIVAPDLTQAESQELLQAAKQRLSAGCRRPWATVDASAENAHDEFYTCVHDNGSTLAVGRLPRDLVAGQWQFSLAVLGPG